MQAMYLSIQFTISSTFIDSRTLGSVMKNFNGTIRKNIEGTTRSAIAAVCKRGIGVDSQGEAHVELFGAAFMRPTAECQVLSRCQ